MLLRSLIRLGQVLIGDSNIKNFAIVTLVDPKNETYSIIRGSCKDDFGWIDISGNWEDLCAPSWLDINISISMERAS